jgi:hypothetical protein
MRKEMMFLDVCISSCHIASKSNSEKSDAKIEGNHEEKKREWSGILVEDTFIWDIEEGTSFER